MSRVRGVGRRAVTGAALVLAILGLSVPVAGASVPADPTFGVEGIAAPALPAPAASAQAGIVDLAAAPGGETYAALRGLSRLDYFGVARIDETGALDPSFGSGGLGAPFPESVSTASPDRAGSVAEAVAVQPDGKVVVAGAHVSRAVVKEDGHVFLSVGSLLVRYLPDGSIDPTFSGLGSDVLDGSDFLHDVVVTPSGRILAAAGGVLRGRGSVQGGVLAFGPDGSPDETFGDDGRAILGGHRFRGVDARAIALRSDGRILLAGFRNDRAFVSRLLPSGRVDRSFGGGDGFAAVVVPNDRCCGRLALALDAAGRLVVAFNAITDRERVYVARFTAEGGLDRSFSGDGILALPARFEGAYGDAAAPDGSVYVTGLARSSGAPNSFTYSVARIGPRGALDGGFGRGGIEAIERGTDSIAGAALALPDGRVLVGGSYSARVAGAGDPTFQTSLLLSRYLPG